MFRPEISMISADFRSLVSKIIEADQNVDVYIVDQQCLDHSAPKKG